MTHDKIARMTGGFYLGFILASFLADTVGHVGISGPQQVYGDDLR
jgi:biotin transporter BioY